MPEFLKIAKVDEVAPGQAKLIEVNGREIALFNIAGSFHAVDNSCTHVGGPLWEGEIDGTEVTCPWHGAVFDVTTGDVLGPPAPEAVTCYQIHVENDDIIIEL
jgi:nitrite reductase/ring-hydroxylating ferredoxin subunit